MGQQLPAELDAIVRLLLLAREHAAEPAVAACLQALHSRANELPPTTCLELLSHLETGVSEHEQLQALGGSLLAAACDRLAAVLAEDAAVRADATVQAQLLTFLGSMQHMLNNAERRDLFAKLPFELLQDCIFEDRNVDADAEVTVLATFALWAERNNRQLRSADRIAAICSRIRLPDIAAGMLQLYWSGWAFLREFDPNREIVMRAVVAAADPCQLAMWRYKEDAAVRNPDRVGLTAAQFKAKCRSWWHPREPRLPLKPAAAEFEVQIPRPESKDEVFSSAHYWGGCFWRIRLSQGAGGRLAIFLMPALNLGFNRFPDDQGKPQLLTFALQVGFGICLVGTGCLWELECREGSWFYPGGGDGRGRMKVEHDGKTVSWGDFWAADSPWLVNGTARVRFKLSAPA